MAAWERVTQIGRSLSDLFRKLKRKPAQTFRDYVAEFNRLLARVIECGCRLPDVASAWLFVDRAAFDETTEVSLLASVGNKYELRLLQQAAIILDRSSRKPWEKAGKPEAFRRHQSVHHTEEMTADTENSDSDGPPLEDDTNDDAEDLYIAYMTAKAKYKDHGKARGVDVEAVKRTARPASRRQKLRASVLHVVNGVIGTRTLYALNGGVTKALGVTVGRTSRRPSTSRMRCLSCESMLARRLSLPSLIPRVPGASWARRGSRGTWTWLETTART